MTGDLRQVLAQLGPLVPIVTAVVLVALVAAIAVRVVPRLRERGYDRVAARERVRLVVALPARDDPDASVPVELIRALHPRQRRGVDAWRVGWPAYELRVAWRAGELAWEIETDGHGAAIATAALRALYPGVSIERSSDRDPTPAAVATGRLTGPVGWPVREVDAPEARPVRALAAALEHAPRGTEVRLRCLARPVPPERWRRDGATTDDDASPSVIGFLVRTIADAILLHPVADPAPKRPAARLTAAERDAEARRRKGVVGFDVALSLEVAGIAAPAAEALLWRLIGFTAALDDGTQAIRWQIRRGASPSGSVTRFADWELAQLVVPARCRLRPRRVRPGAPARRRATGHARGRRSCPGHQPRSRPRPVGRRPRPPPRGLRVDGLGQEHAPAQPRRRARRLADRGDRHRPPRRSHGRHPRPPPGRPPQPESTSCAWPTATTRAASTSSSAARPTRRSS